MKKYIKALGPPNPKMTSKLEAINIKNLLGLNRERIKKYEFS
jgi:hypothetical protein